VIAGLAQALRSRGYLVDLNVGQSKFRCDLAVRSKSDNLYQLGILVDTDSHYSNPNLLDRYLMQPGILRAFGWRFAMVLTKDWYHNPDDVLERIEKLLRGIPIVDYSEPEEEEPAKTIAPAAQLHTPAPTPTSITAPQNVATPPKEPVTREKPTAVPEPASTAGSTRRFEFVSGSSSKFWEISTSGNSFTVRFGRLGTAGQSQTKSFTDAASARREAESLIAQKLNKGYVEVNR
jgi:predicted DNA-binding WGR domain protein